MRVRARSVACLALAGLFAATAGIAHAQEPAGPIHPAPGANDKKPAINLKPPADQKPIVVRTTEIVAPVTVQNRDGDLVLDLEQQDFHVFDNGAEQSILHFDLGGDPDERCYTSERRTNGTHTARSRYRLNVVKRG